MQALAARLSRILFAASLLTAIATAQSFHAERAGDADANAWRKIEMWKEHLVDPTSVARVEWMLTKQREIGSGRAEVLAGLRDELFEATGDEPLLDGILASEYVSLRLGYFDLHYPIHYLQDKDKVKELSRLAVALLDLQVEFLDWLGLRAAGRASEKESEPRVVPILQELRASYEGWKPRPLSPTSLNEASARFEEKNESPAARQLANYMRRQLWIDEETSREPLDDLQSDTPKGLQVIMAPDLQNFVGIACAFSVLDELEQIKDDGQRIADYVWYDTLPTWTYFYWPDVSPEEIVHYQVMGSEYSTTDVGDIWALDGPGAKMDEVTTKKNGLEQHLVQHVGERFLHTNYMGRMHLSVQNGLATDFVFEIYDENSERSSGSGVASQTQAREIFIPGAPSEGGTLPAISADNRVRRAWKKKTGTGGDRFQYFLSHQLSDGRKVAKKQLGKSSVDAHACYFPIYPSDNNLDKRVVYPPLLTAPGHEVREFFRGTDFSEFAPDHRAFFRAYRVYFAHWMRTEAGSSGNGNAEQKRAEAELAFSRFLRLAAVRAIEAGLVYHGDTIHDTPFHAAVGEVFGMPLSGPHMTDPDSPNLEGRCLRTIQ